MLLIFTLTFLGCSKNAISAEQTAKAFYDLVILQDNTGFQNLGVTDNELIEIAETQKKLMKEATKSNFVQTDLPITDEQLESIYQCEVEALRKLSYTQASFS
jgi:ketopantoate hydroxymethyltransferase